MQIIGITNTGCSIRFQLYESGGFSAKGKAKNQECFDGRLDFCSCTYVSSAVSIWVKIVDIGINFSKSSEVESKKDDDNNSFKFALCRNSYST